VEADAQLNKEERQLHTPLTPLEERAALLHCAKLYAHLAHALRLTDTLIVGHVTVVLEHAGTARHESANAVKTPTLATTEVAAPDEETQD